MMTKLSVSRIFSAAAAMSRDPLAENIKEISPIPTSKVFFTSSGSRPTTPDQLQWYYNTPSAAKKKKIISACGLTTASPSLPAA